MGNVRPLITVAMSVFNGARHLPQAIESILAQTDSAFEFLIVNDGSTDATAAILASYAALDARIRVIEQPNQGLVASLNRLLAESKAPFVARMDADDIALPHRFARQRAFLEKNPDFGVVGSWALDIEEDGRPRFSKRVAQPTDHLAFLSAIESDRPLICHPAAMMRRDVILSVGGYRAAFKHCEDYDLWLRLASVTKLCSLPEALIQYRYSETQVSHRHLVEQQIGAALAKLAYIERCAGRPDPTDGLTTLPVVDDFDALFGREGAAQEARQLIAPALLYSPVALRGSGFPLILDYVHDGHASLALWRTAARLARLRLFSRAWALAIGLLTRRG